MEWCLVLLIFALSVSANVFGRTVKLSVLLPFEICHIAYLTLPFGWKQRWKQLRETAITAATETLDPDLRWWQLSRAKLDPRECLSENSRFILEQGSLQMDLFGFYRGIQQHIEIIARLCTFSTHTLTRRFF